jgi:hypothetical protein
MEKNSTLEDTDNEEYILKLKPNYCVFSAFFIDPFLVLMGFLLTFVSYSLYTWWSMILALILFVISLGQLKALFMKEVILDKEKVTLKWYLFRERKILINQIKEILPLSVGLFCTKTTFYNGKRFDFNHLLSIINDSTFGEQNIMQLKQEINKLIGEIK